MARLSPADDRRWLGLARRAAPPLEARTGHEVLANRWDPADGRLRPIGPALDRARAAARRLASRSETLLRTDVAAFYPSVTPGRLHDALVRAGARDGARDAARMLAEWAEHGYIGLPIGPDASAVLANALLLPLDAALRRARLPFRRWVDDVLVAVPPARIGDALDRIDTALASAGLRRSLPKTLVVDARALRRWPGGVSGPTSA